MTTYSRGYITLISVLIIGAVGLAIATSLVVLGVGGARSGFALQQSSAARAVANACAEEGLQQIRDAVSYTGTATIVLGSGSCTYTVTDEGGQNRRVTAEGTVGTVVRRVAVSITAINPRIVVSTWQEVADF